MMKKYGPTALLALIIGIIVIICMNLPRKYEWNPTFSHTSDEPFGCALFDSLLFLSLPGGYEVADDIPDSLIATNTAIIYAKYDLDENKQYIDSIEYQRAKTLLRLAQNGAVIVVAIGDFNCGYYDEEGEVLGDYILEQAYNLKKKDSYYVGWATLLNGQINERKNTRIDRVILTWTNDNSEYAVERFMVNNRHLATFRPTKPYETLVNYTYNDDNELVKECVCYSKSYPNGGRIVFVGLPLLMTNYAIMDGKTAELTLKLLEPIGDRHTVRIMGKNPLNPNTKANKNSNENENTEFSYLLSQPALKWALNLTLALLLIFSIFNARRKMRAIPLERESKNATLDFAKFVGTFHFRRNRHKELVLTKYSMLLRHLRQTYGWEVESMSAEDLARNLEEKTGLSAYLLERFIKSMNYLKETDDSVTQDEMMKFIDKIKEIEAKTNS